jgi:predicted esterase YcpF (UPF0227 family)
MSLTKLIDVGHSKDLLIVTFGGHAKKMGGIPPFEFLNFLKKNFPNADKQFYIDINACCYSKGIAGITNNVEETVEYLSNEIKEYKKVVFIGSSGGGYAAILFGSILNIHSVISFIPTTIIRKTNVNPKYKNLRPFINETTLYHLYGDIKITDTMDCHHISHCENIAIGSNTIIYKKNGLDLKKMRDSGELLQLFQRHVV